MLLCMVVNVETVINVNDLLLIVHVLAHFIKRRRPLDESLFDSKSSRRMQLTVHRCHNRGPRGFSGTTILLQDACGQTWTTAQH